MNHKENLIYTILTALVICGLAASIVTAPKIVHIGFNFPFSNIIFSIFTYPIVDCICELWGKKIARQTVWISLACQVLIMGLIQASIIAPPAPFWQHQSEYQTILSTGKLVVIAGVLAFSISQVLDIFLYQRIKELSNGRFLWLRSNISIYLAQIIDSGVFISIVFYESNNKLNIFLGSISIKIILSLLMTPCVYLIVIAINKYLDANTMAFRVNNKTEDFLSSPACGRREKKLKSHCHFCI